MSGPTIRINDGGSFPEVSIGSDAGQTLEISNINDFDLGLLGNQRKLVGTPPRAASPGVTELKEVDNIEFVNLDDTAVKFDVMPPETRGGGDTIKIVRDTKPIEAPSLNLGSSFGAPAPAPAPAPVAFGTAPAAAPASAPAPATKSWFSSLTGGANASTTESSGGGGIGGFKSWFSGGSSAGAGAAAPSAPAPLYSEYLTPEQENAKKMEGLTQLERMDRKGIGGTKMTVANSLDEINAEVARRKDSKNLEASIRFQRSMLTTVTNGLEFLNNRYDPLGVALDGWSESIHENIEDYDEIFEELYDKYKDKSKVAPEVRLVMTLGLSAAMCHVTNTMFKSKTPGMEDILRKNPELRAQMARAAAEQAVGPGFANFVSMGMPSRPAPQPAPPTSMPMGTMESVMEEDDGMPFMPPMGSGIGGAIPSVDPRGPPTGVATARREMRGPVGVEDILNTLNANGNAPNRNVPVPAAVDEDRGSVNSGFTTDTMRRNGVSRRRKATTVQPTGSTLTLNV